MKAVIISIPLHQSCKVQTLRLQKLAYTRTKRAKGTLGILLDSNRWRVSIMQMSVFELLRVAMLAISP